MDISQLSQKELAELINAANKRKKVLAKRRPATAVKNAVNRFLLQNGWTFEELYGRAGGRSSAAVAPASAPAKAAKSPRKAATRKGGKVPPKYRNPADASETWTGRGKHPRWMAAYIAQGKKPEDFLI